MQKMLTSVGNALMKYLHILFTELLRNLELVEFLCQENEVVRVAGMVARGLTFCLFFRKFYENPGC